MVTSVKLQNDIEIFHFQTGTVAVRPPHREFTGLVPPLRLPRILASNRWTDDMPISVWLIKSPDGNFLIDTGENINVFDEDYFGDAKPDAFINRRILKLKITEELQINNQLAEIGVEPADIDAVILTHLHLDHTDGLKFFQNQEVLVSKTEWTRPFGAAMTTFPKGFAPKQITFESNDSPFESGYQLTKNITVVPTPGHTHGHQSVLVHDDGIDYMLAGDVSFTDTQLLQNKRPGIIVDWPGGLKTYEKVRQYAAERPLVYLPSHDLNTPNRLVSQITL